MPSRTEFLRTGQHRAAALVLAALWLTSLVACVEHGDHEQALLDAGVGNAEVEVEQSEQALLGSASKSIPAITQRNAIITQPFAPQLLTPDGRLGLFWTDGNTVINLVALADPSVSVSGGAPRFSAKMAQGQGRSLIAPGRVATTRNLTDVDGGLAIPAGSNLSPWVNSGQGTLAFDPRFSPGGKPFAVQSAADCLSATVATRETLTSPAGRVECYRLIHLQPFRYQHGEGDAKVLLLPLYQAQLAVAVDARRPDTTTGVAARSAAPNVIVAHYLTQFEISGASSTNPFFLWALEPSATGDGRLLVTQRGYWSFNETPWNPRTWTVQRPLEDMFENVRNNVDGTQRICRRLHPTTGNPSCGYADEDQFARVYTLAAQPLRLADGQPSVRDLGDGNSSSHVAGCGYPWITPEGTDVFCRPHPYAQPFDSALERAEGFESSTGMHYVSFGQHTGWMIRRIDGGINTRRFNPENLLTPPGDVETMILTRPFSPLFLNTSTGFWAENRARQDASLPILRQWPVFQFMTQNHALDSAGPTYTSLGLNPSAGTALQSNMQYWEASFACSVNPKCLLHLPMNELFYDLNAADLRAQPRTADVSSNTDFFAPDGERLAELHPYVGDLVGGARFIGEIYTASNDERYMSGFRGTGISLRATSAVSVSSALSDPLAVTTPCARSKGCLSGESFEGFTAEMAFLPLFNPSSSSLSLAQHHGLWSLKIVNGLLTAEVFYTLPNGTRTSTVLTSTRTLPFSSFFSTPAAQAPQWLHVSIRATRPNSVSLFINGVAASNQGFPTGAVFSATAAGSELIKVGPAGTCTNCPIGDILFVDELVFHKTPLRDQEIAASAGAFAGRSDLLTPTQARRLLASFFSATNPKNLSLEADGFPRFVRAEDLRIPSAFASFAQPGWEAAFRQLVAVGNALFISPVLSTNSAGASQSQSGTGQLISCATCHNPSQSFTDGRVAGVGLQPLTLNTPTIINRAFGTNHLFGQGATSLLSQALRPVTDPREMNGDINKILERINTGADQAALRQGFAGVFGNTPVTTHHLQMALSAFQLVQLSVDSLAEAMVAAGEPVIDPQGNLLRVEDVRLGKDLFEGKARCSSCHTGPNLSDELSHDTGVSRTPEAFKTPTLWDVASTGPYFHDGSRDSLRSVLNFYNFGGPAPERMTNGALRTTDPEMRPLGLNERELNALETYLRTLQNARPVLASGLKGLVFSDHGPIPGLFCTPIAESADTQASWDDNYLCSSVNYGFQYSSAGPISGMTCTAITDADEPAAHTWNDNYLCVPNGSSMKLRWSQTGPIFGKTCVRFYEPSDSTNWYNNHLCYDELLKLRFSSDGPIAGLVCTSVSEPLDALHGWDNNYVCSNKDVGLRFSAAGPLAGMRCTRVHEDAEPAGVSWSDNYLCVPPASEAVFSWSQAGPLSGQSCTLFNEPQDPYTWADNYLCVRDGSFTSVIGCARDIGAGADGSVWVIGCGPSANAGIHKWNGSTWDMVTDGGVGVRIAVEPSGKPWVVNSEGAIYTRTSSSPYLGAWVNVPGCARDIAVGSGSVWVIGCDAAPGGYTIQKYNGRAWDRAPGGAVRIAVDGAGVPWVVNSVGSIFKRSSASALAGVFNVVTGPEAARDIGIGANGEIWVTGWSTTAGGHPLFVWHEQLSQWVGVPGGGVNITVGPSGPWLINSVGTIFRRPI